MCAMVVTAVGAANGETAGGLTAPLLENLAVLLRRAGRRVLLADAAAGHACARWAAARAHAGCRPYLDALRLDGDGLGQRIECAAGGYDVVLVDAGGCDGRAWRPALIAARLALVPLAAQDADLDRNYRLAAQLNVARMFNPGLHVLFVPAADGAAGQSAAAALAASAVRAYAGEVMAARVLPGLLEVDALSAPDGLHAGDEAGAAAGTAFGRTPPLGATAAALAMLVEDINGASRRPHGRSAPCWLRRPAWA